MAQTFHHFLILCQEFLYFWNGFSFLERAPQLVQPLLDYAEREWTRWQQNRKQSEVAPEDGALFIFVRALCLRALGKRECAREALLEIVGK